MPKILFEPFNSTGFYQDKFFEISKPFKALKKILEERGYEVHTVDCVSLDDPDIKKIIFFNLNQNNEYFQKAKRLLPRDKMELVLFEPPVVLPDQYRVKFHEHFSRVHTWDDDLVDNKKYLKFFWMNSSLDAPVKQPIFEEREMAVLINARKESNQPNELYSERIKAIEFFERNHLNDFDLYGHFWEEVLPQDPPGTILDSHNSYRGSVNNKYQTLSKYKFSICYENMGNVKGYITEKIFDVIMSKCVPIYLGASNITDYIPENAFIDRRNFSSYDELYQFMKVMNSTSHQNFINAGNKFLNSPESGKWFDRGWAEGFVRSTLG